MTLISPEDAQDFLRLHLLLMHYAGTKRSIVPQDTTMQAFMDTDLEIKVACRDAIYEPTPLFQDFLADRDNQLSSEDKVEVMEWEKYVRGDFMLLKHLKRHSIFMTVKNPLAIYGVYSLTTDLAETIAVPIIVSTVLLPFRDKIVCDGLVGAGLFIGRNMERDLHQQYMEFKKAQGIITTL